MALNKEDNKNLNNKKIITNNKTIINKIDLHKRLGHISLIYLDKLIWKYTRI